MPNPDDLPPARILALALTDYDGTTNPAVRAFVNIFATKITSLTHTEILELSDEKIIRILETEFSRRSDDELCSLLDASILVAKEAGLFDSIGDMILKGFINLVKSDPIPFQFFGCFLCIQFGTSCFSLNLTLIIYILHPILLCYSYSSSSYSFL